MSSRPRPLTHTSVHELGVKMRALSTQFSIPSNAIFLHTKILFFYGVFRRYSGWKFRLEAIAAPPHCPSKKHKSDVNIFHGGPFAAIYKEHGPEPMPPLNRNFLGECWVEQNKTYRPSKFFNQDGSHKEGAADALEKLKQCWKFNITVFVLNARDLQHLEALKGTHTLKFHTRFNLPVHPS